MRTRRTIAAALTGVLAAAALTACGGSGTSSSGGGGTGTTVLNIGMPDGPQTDNNNPFLGTSAASALGYRYMIYEPLVMTSSINPTSAGTPWLASSWTWSNNY